ncbi:MAG: hypothetical protein ACK56F_00735 [bacterium]
MRPGESTYGQLGRDWTPPSCNGVSFRLVLGESLYAAARVDLL